jgi:hypothetical protein
LEMQYLHVGTTLLFAWQYILPRYRLIFTILRGVTSWTTSVYRL